MSRVVITGMGAVSCLGNSLDDISASLRTGRSGIAVDEQRVAHGFRSPLTGVIKDYDVRAYVTKKQVKSMGQPAQFAVGAAVQAVQDAGLNPDALRTPMCGMIVGNDSCALPTVEAVDVVRAQKETRGIGSGSIIQVMNSTVTMNLTTFFGTRGASWTLSAACASGAHALGQGLLLVKAGMQDMMLVGGAQEINWQGMVSFDALGAFAKHDGNPHTASKPFDKERRGLVPSGGAAMLVLERLDHAQKRGARIYGELLGYGFSSDGEHLTQPSGEGAVRAMRAALSQGKVSPSDVDYINAHATATPQGDLAEGRAILAIFGQHGAKVSSTKSMTGHECWMAGASEVVYSLLMMRDGFLAPNINLGELAPELVGLNVVRAAESTRPRLVLSNSFGFGGTNAALLLGSPPESIA